MKKLLLILLLIGLPGQWANAQTSQSANEIRKVRTEQLSVKPHKAVLSAKAYISPEKPVPASDTSVKPVPVPSKSNQIRGPPQLAGFFVYNSAPVSGVSNRSIDFPGCTTSGCGTSKFATITSDFDSSGIFDFTNHTGSGYIRYKVDSYPSGDWQNIIGASDGGWGRGFALTQNSTNLYFWVAQWNTNFVSTPRPATGTWANAVFRLEKNGGGGGVQLCMNGTDATPDTLSANISDTLTIDLRLGDTLSSGFGKEFDGVIDTVALWSTFMDSTSKGTLCAAGYKGDPSAVYANPTKYFKIQSDDVVTGAAAGITNTGTVAGGATGSASLSLSTDVAP